MTLSIGRINGGNRNYHLGEITDPAIGYYATGLGMTTVGSLARQLDIPEEILRDGLANLLIGMSPDGTTRLRETDVKVFGFDSAYSPGKDVSIMFALGSEVVQEQILIAHLTAISQSIDYTERYAVWARRGAGGSQQIPGDPELPGFQCIVGEIFE